jgi:hypothetical protein
MIDESMKRLIFGGKGKQIIIFIGFISSRMKSIVGGRSE